MLVLRRGRGGRKCGRGAIFAQILPQLLPRQPRDRGDFLCMFAFGTILHETTFDGSDNSRVDTSTAATSTFISIAACATFNGEGFLCRRRPFGGLPTVSPLKGELLAEELSVRGAQRGEGRSGAGTAEAASCFCRDLLLPPLCALLLPCSDEWMRVGGGGDGGAVEQRRLYRGCSQRRRGGRRRRYKRSGFEVRPGHGGFPCPLDSFFVLSRHCHLWALPPMPSLQRVGSSTGGRGYLVHRRAIAGRHWLLARSVSPLSDICTQRMQRAGALGDVLVSGTGSSL
mmetsp:Transcript_27926/g.70156  ORF Transcript_27926/g.70156 Transcript_27926/m.70156 type:complete len:284 (-) Transcript_27926:143-994(-)